MVLAGIRNSGVLHLPGASPASKHLVEKLLLKDAEQHHCFFRPPSYHNHLSHHILAAYDLGASPGLLQVIYDHKARIQKPIIPKDGEDIVVTEDNWKTYLANQSAYGAFVVFFSARVEKLGAQEALEQYVFAPCANENGANMFIRLVSGAFHPFIQLGCGVEFGYEKLVATALAQTAVTVALPSNIFSFKNPDNAKENPISNGTRQPSRGPSILELLRQAEKSDILKPVMPYDPDATVYARLKAALSDGRPEEIHRICSQFHVDEELGEEEFNSKIEECIWAATLLMFATGREGKAPRLDFFLMHLVTSCLFFQPVFKILPNPAHKANILRAFISVSLLISIVRGRPTIKPDLLMSYTETPRPPLGPSQQPTPDPTWLGDPTNDDHYNPWPTLVASAIHAPDAHVLKTLRTLIFAAQRYGVTPPGGAIGAFTNSNLNGADALETHRGTSKMDGTIFTRAAGMLMNYMGWVTHDQPARDDWDRSALGWDEAWDKED